MPKHPDFEQIYQNFINQYGEEQGENYYYAWLSKNELDDTKPYNVEEQYFMRESLQESFHWVKPQTVEELNRTDTDAKYYKLRALTANMSMNKNDYRDHEKMMRAARSLSWRPLNMNHDHTQWLPFPDARVHFATFEDGAVESIIRIPNYLDDIQYKLDTGEIIHPSIEGFPLEGYGKATAEGFEPEFYTFTALALLEKGVQLPGDPLTTINPLTESVQTWMTSISESMGHSLVESLKRRKKMKEQEQTTVEPTEFTDEERAKRHYELTDEQWSLLTPEERQDLISKLPRKAEETPPATSGVVEQEQSEKPPKDWWDACVAHVTKGDPEKICGDIFFHKLGGDRSKADPSMFNEQLEEPLEVTAPEEQSVEVEELPAEIPVCDVGTHWDPEQMECVPDEIPTGETAGADATTPGPEQTMPLVTEQADEETDEYGCVVGKERWNGEVCVAIEPETTEKLKEQDEPIDLQVQGEEILTEPSHVEPKPCEPGTHWDATIGDCVPDEPSEPEGALDVTEPEKEVTIAEIMKEKVQLEREKLAVEREKVKALNEVRKWREDSFMKEQEVTRLERKLTETKSSIAELEREDAHNKTKFADMESTIRDLSGSKGSLKSRLATAHEEIRRLREQNSDITHDLEKCVMRRDDVAERNIHNLKELREAMSKLQQTEKSLMTLRRDQVDIQKKVAELSEDNATLTKDNIDLSEKYAESAKKTYATEKANVELHKQIVELNGKIKKQKKFGKIIVKA